MERLRLLCSRRFLESCRFCVSSSSCRGQKTLRYLQKCTDKADRTQFGRCYGAINWHDTRKEWPNCNLDDKLWSTESRWWRIRRFFRQNVDHSMAHGPLQGHGASQSKRGLSTVLPAHFDRDLRRQGPLKLQDLFKWWGQDMCCLVEALLVLNRRPSELHGLAYGL